MYYLVLHLLLYHIVCMSSNSIVYYDVIHYNHFAIHGVYYIRQAGGSAWMLHWEILLMFSR